MIVIDANLLLYAYDATMREHAAARKWLEPVLSNEPVVGLPWQSIGAFIRIATSNAWPGNRYSMTEAAALVDKWLGRSNVFPLAPGEGHWRILRELVIEGQVRGPLTTDAQLAALTIEHGGTLYTTDRDFARFPGLRWTNPLV